MIDRPIIGGRLFEVGHNYNNYYYYYYCVQWCLQWQFSIYQMVTSHANANGLCAAMDSNDDDDDYMGKRDGQARAQVSE